MNQNVMQRYGNLLSIRDWLRYAVSRFNRADLSYGHGTDNAYDEAAYLILHTLHLPPDTLDPFLDARLLDHERAAVRAEGEHAGVIVPLKLRTSQGMLSFLSTTTVFGSPVDVTLQELAVESFFPTDPDTAQVLRDWASAAAGRGMA